METIRTFVAVDVSNQVAQRAAGLIRRLQASEADVRWVDAQRMHLTLKFLGDVPNTDIAAVCQAVADASSAHAPFDMSCRGAGAFPRDDRPRTVWLGFPQAEPLVALQGDIDEALHAIGFPVESRRFHPHLTIGRVRQGGATQRRLAELLTANADFDAGDTEVDEVLIYASFLDRAGPTYEVLGRAPLGIEA